MPKIKVTRSKQIDAPVGKVFASVRDFKQWKPWSPWVIAEPGCELSYPEDGKSYGWEGKIIGSGNMTILREEADRSIDCQLAFLKPWKSQAEVRFDFSAKDGGTEVVWSMDSSLPFFMFFFRGMMEAFIGMDYERGLSMLKDHIEKGGVESKLAFPGKKKFVGCNYVGIRRECSMDEMPKLMKEDFCTLKESLAKGAVKADEKPFSIYHKWNPVKKRVDYTIGVTVTSPPADLPGGMFAGEIPSCEVYQVEHTGRYDHLGNAWSAGMMHGRAKQFKQLKSIPPFEIYENDPSEEAEKDLVTVVHLPAK